MSNKEEIKEIEKILKNSMSKDEREFLCLSSTSPLGLRKKSVLIFIFMLHCF